jgi:acetylxylan esterase
VNKAAWFSAVALCAVGSLWARGADAASLQMVSNWGASGVPSYISMYVYVPDKPAASPPILVVAHYCGGSASAVFGQAQGGGIVSAADKYGFMMIFPQTTNSASSAKCWEVGSKASLTHDGGGDTQAVAQMVKYAIKTYNANPNRVYATGDSSGGMMTQALLGVYPDVFKGGSSFAGVAAGCWSAGWSAASNWGGTCAGGNDIMTAQQWGDLVRGMYPGYTGHRPRVQLFHGDADPTINYKNYGESIKEWTNVLGLAMSPTTTTMNLTLGSHKATRQQWQNSCGYVVLDGFTSIGGDHGPSDALFNSSYVIPFLGLDNTGAVDPEIAACGGDGGVGGSGGTGGAGGTTGAGGNRDGGVDGNRDGGNDAPINSGAGGVAGSDGGNAGAAGRGGNGGRGGSAGTQGMAGTTGTAGAVGIGGTTGGGGTTGAAGTTGNGGITGGAGTTGTSGSSGVGTGGASSTGAAGTTGGGGPGDGGASGCNCALGDAPPRGPYTGAALAIALALLGVRRRRRNHR